MRRSGRNAPRRSRGASTAVLLSLAVLAACSGGDEVSSPTQETTDTFHVIAHAELLDATPPCTVAPCPPELVECLDRSPRAVGATWDLRANIATAGWTVVSANREPGQPANFVIGATDSAAQTSLTMEWQVDPRTLAASLPAVQANWFDIQTLCNQLNPNLQPESRMRVISGTVTVTSAEIVSIRDSVTDPDTLPDPEFVSGVPSGGSFSPAGIVAGTFDVIAEGLQVLPTGTVAPRLHVTGCFRLPMVDIERGVPVTPNPVGVSCP